MSLTVDEVNDARIETTGDPNMYSDEGELVDDTFDTPDATEAITWSASGLPVGLSINSMTGQISGRPQYTEAGAHAVTLTATASGGDTDQVELTWNVADVNRLPWIDDQAEQEWDNVSIDYYAHDNINSPSEWEYEFSGLPSGMSGPNGAIPVGAAGDYNVTISMTAGGATDARTYHWLIAPEAQPIPPGQTPAPGVSAFAIDDTFVHHDDVGLVDQHQRMAVKLFLTELDYVNVVNNSLEVKLQVVTGNAGLTTDPDNPVGSTSIIVSPTEMSGLAGIVHTYLIPHAPSVATDDIVIKALRQINGAWQMMGGGGGDNAVNNVVIGTGRDSFTGEPNYTHAGKIAAETTPAAMFWAGQLRIPPRNWDATDLWVTKTGVIGMGKSLYLVAPRDLTAAQNGNGQSDINGRVALCSTENDWNAERWAKLEDQDFAAGVAKVWIWGHLKGNRVYQTEPGRAGRLTLGVYSAKDDTDPPKSLGREFATTYGFSVAAIPVTLTQKYYSDAYKYDDPEDPAYIKSRLGIITQLKFESDSGKVTDLDAARYLERVQIKAQNGCFKGEKARVATEYTAIVLPEGRVNLDRHTVRVEAVSAWRKAKVTGDMVVGQVYVFQDSRTGVSDIEIKNSGFKIAREFYVAPEDQEYHLKTRISGEAVTVRPPMATRDYTSGAGKTDPADKIELIEPPIPSKKK